MITVAMRYSLIIALLLHAASPVAAQILSYPDPFLDYIFPAGGQRGQTVTVEFGGLNGLYGATKLIVDGPPGVTVAAVKPGDSGKILATLNMAGDAAPGRRWLRVLGGMSGLTNARQFFVGTMAETNEKEPNNTAAAPQEVTLPVVVNGRIEKELDVDCYRFAAKAGQKFVAGLFAHGMDSTVRVTFNRGFVDASLELLDEQGKVLAAADDTIGLDPVLEYQFQRDGKYTIRVQSLAYQGSPGSVYRLTLGDVPYPTSVYPPGGRRGAALQATWNGFNLAKPITQTINLERESPLPFQFVAPPVAVSDGRDFLVLRGDDPDVLEKEPNDDQKNAVPLTMPMAAFGRFEKKGDVDWYRMTLKKDQGVVLDVTAQRHLRSPVDTALWDPLESTCRHASLSIL